MVLLDIRMPEMDGFEVCQQLKAVPKTADVPILFISALDDIQDKMRAFSIGGVDYITKPLQVQEVLARVGAHLELRRLERKLQEANRRYAQELALAGSLQQSFLAHPALTLPGWQMATAFRPAREIPVLFISALDDVYDKLRGFSAGGIDYITKPFQVQEVLARVGAHLGLRNHDPARDNRDWLKKTHYQPCQSADYLPPDG